MARIGGISSEDEHVIKLIHALDDARSLAAGTDDGMHGLAAAALALGRA